MKRVKNRLLIGFAALVAVGLSAGLAQAQEGVSALKGHDSHAPVDISADRGEAQDRADRVVFAGNVIVKQQELTLRTARLTVAYSNSDSSGNGIDINRIDASGGVVVTSPSETARGDFGVYDLDKGLITLVGNVRLDRGGSFLNGGRLTIDLNSGRAVMDGGLRGVSQGGGGRVSGRFTVPKRNTTTTTKPATPAKPQ
jgi:lipopolysaccharide export system protein LptA